jgi:oxygen-dependent protoporphyrinogen oxidase
MQLVLSYIGGATNRGIVDQPEDQIVKQVDKDLRQMLVKPDAAEPKVIAVRTWPRAIPQFNKGHLDAVEAAKADLQKAGLGAVFLGGNYVAGVALGKCVEYGAGEYASQIAKYLASQGQQAGTAGVQKQQDSAFYEGEIPVSVPN